DPSRTSYFSFETTGPNARVPDTNGITTGTTTTDNGSSVQSFLLYNGDKLTIVTPSETVPDSARSEEVQEDHTPSFVELARGVKI
ncbi:hypothetical protein Q8G50_32975, partial [Klebsiella pneumoniae]